MQLLSRSLAGSIAAVLLLVAPCAAARAELVIAVDKTAQQMTVSRDGALLYTWPVSTGRSGYDTPSGSFKPSSMERQHYSREMGRCADAELDLLHARGPRHPRHIRSARRLGSAVSHGCVRLSRKNAATLYELVTAEGLESTRMW